MNISTFLLAFMLVLYAPASFAQSGPIQQLPPTPIGSTAACPSGTQQVLSYSGTASGGPQGGINCVPIVTDAAGDISASGYVQMGNTSALCNATLAGAVRFDPLTLVFEGCNGSGWQPLGGSGTTIIEGGCQSGWSSCPSGFRATSYFSPGTYNCCDRCSDPAWHYTVCSQ